MASSSWCRETDEKINYTKLCRLLVDGGTQAVCSVFDGIHPPSSLKAILNANKTTLQKLKKPRGKVLNNDQWDKLYPASGRDPKSEDFDITLLFVLLRNICGLTPPATAWDVLPPGTDTSQEANLARIKYYRNNRLAHKPNTEINDADFEQHWQDISSALLSLGLSQGDIDELKSAPLGEKDYKQLLHDWYMSDEDIKTQLDDVKAYTVEIKSDAVDIKEKVDELHKMQTEAWKHNNPVNNLFMDEFTGNIKSLCERYAQNTRLWVLDQVKSHVNVDSDQPDSSIMLITAGPGMGKSTIAAKICQTYKDLGCLAGCHFFQFSNSTRNNPKLMIQSIARQMCDTVPGYQEVLESKLRTKLGKTLDDMNCEELFTVLLEEPCHKLKVDRGSFVVVLDAIDECCSSLKQELQDILKNKLPFLPSWLRLVITTRPPPSFNAFKAKQSIFIYPTDSNNQRDIEFFFEANLKSVDNRSLIIEELVKVSRGLFLVAFFLIDELEDETISSPTELMSIFPSGLSSVYEKYFERLRTVLLPYITEEEGFFKMLKAVVASKDPLPFKMMYGILGLKNATEVCPGERKGRSNALSQLHSLFPVENDHVRPFHKSVVDFLIIEESEPDFNTSAKKMSKESVEKLPDAAENLQGTSGISDASSHVEGESVGTSNKEREQNNSSNTVHTRGPSKDDDFGVHVDDGNKVLIDHCYEVLGDIMQEKKDLNKPLDLTDSEKYALDFVWNFLKSSNDRRFFNYFLISALLCYRQYENGNIQSQTYNSEVDDPFHRVVLICARFFLVQLRHEKGCPFAQPLNFGRYVEFVLQIVIQNQIDKETATELLQKYKLSYCQYKVVDVHKEFHDKQSSISNLGCGNEFVVIKHTVEPNTVVIKYQQDGTVLFQKCFHRKRNVYVSPNHLFIVVVEELGRNIEIRNAKTMEPVKSYPSPNVIRSCHMFGDHPWYIVARCYNNKIYVMEGETGTVVSTIAGIGQYVEVEAVSHLGHILLGTSNRYTNDSFTDEDGNFLEEMEWHNDNMVFGLQGTRQYRDTKNSYQRKLFLYHYKKPDKKVPIYPTKKSDWCCTSNTPQRSTYGYGESVCFSPDGSLLAFHYRGCIFIRNTGDGSLYKRVYLGPNHFDIFDHRGVLLVTKDHVVVYNGSRFNENAIMIINLHTNNIEHIYCCTSGLLLFHPKTNDQPFRLITNRHSENECKVYLCTLHNLDL